jgi:hypothetical protein
MNRPALLISLLFLCPSLLGGQNLFSPGVTAQDVKTAVAAGVDLEVKNKDGLTALIYAASNNPNVDVVKELLAAGAQVNAVCGPGHTALIYAAYNQSNPDIVRALRDGGAEVDRADNAGMTALMWAAKHNPRPAITQALIDAGASLTLKSKDGKTAYDFAAENTALRMTPAYAALGDQRSNDEKAREAYTSGLALARAGNHAGAVERLDAAVSFLGRTNLKIQPALIRSLVAEMNYSRARLELAAYFGMSPDPALAEFAAMKDLGASTDKALQQDETLYKASVKKADGDALLAYIAACPFGLHLSEVAALYTRMDDSAYADAMKDASAGAYAGYLAKFSRGAHTRDISARLTALRDDQAFAAASSLNTKAAYADYQKSYPQGRHVTEARAAWNSIDKTEKDKARVQAAARREVERRELTDSMESAQAEANGHYLVGTLMVVGGVGLGAVAGWALLSSLGSTSSDSGSSDSSTMSMIGAGALLPAALLIVFCKDNFSQGDYDAERAADAAHDLARLSVGFPPVPAAGGMRRMPGFSLSVKVPIRW